MPSARKRRLRKLIKGHINRTDRQGNVVNATASAVKSASVVMNEKTEAELITALSISADGKTSDVDADGVAQAKDFAPFDATEQSGSDGVGNNQLIVDLFQEMSSLTSEITAFKGVNNTQKAEAVAALAAAQTNKKTGADNAALWCAAVASLQSTETIGSSNQESSETKFTAVTSLETRILAIGQPTLTDVSLEGLNPRDIFDTDAEAKQDLAETENTAVGSLNTIIVESVSTVKALEDEDPSQIPTGADCPIDG